MKESNVTNQRQLAYNEAKDDLEKHGFILGTTVVWLKNLGMDPIVVESQIIREGVDLT